MALGTRFTEDLVRIAAAGGGLKFDIGARFVEDLVQIAAATRTGGGQLVLENVGARFTEDLVRIAMAGGGHVQFSD